MKKSKVVLSIGLVLLALITVGGILWHQTGIFSEAVPPCGFEKYLQVIRSGDQDRLKYVPEVWFLEVAGSWIPLRQPAADFLASTRGEAVHMGGDWGFYLMEPRAEQLVTSPVRVKLWHRTNHYGGGILRVLDANKNVLAELWLREISHYNMTYHYYETEIAFEQPATVRGFIVGLPWSSKGEESEAEGKIVPILFSSGP